MWCTLFAVQNIYSLCPFCSYVSQELASQGLLVLLALSWVIHSCLFLSFSRESLWSIDLYLPVSLPLSYIIKNICSLLLQYSSHHIIFCKKLVTVFALLLMEKWEWALSVSEGLWISIGKVCADDTRAVYLALYHW